MFYCYTKYFAIFILIFLTNAVLAASSNSNYKIQHVNEINLLLQRIDPAQVQANLVRITSLPDRYVNSKSGVQAAQWIKHQVEKMVIANARNDVDIYLLPTINDAKQSSVILKIGKDLQEPGIVIGAHLDTLESSDEFKPGADDDASGVVTVLETARIILNSSLRFKKPIYFIWYAGEEEKKLGSQSVVKEFNQRKIPIDAVMQLDMVGYIGKDGRGIGLTDDYTDVSLTAYVGDLVATYLKIPSKPVHCGYMCSDHVTWHQNGNRVVYPFEAMDDDGNPFVHTSEDTLEKISLDHVIDFVKLSAAFAVELGEPLVG